MPGVTDYEIIKNNYLFHFINRLKGIDLKNYEGEKPNEFGNIIDLKRFSLDKTLLESITLEDRLVFVLAEKSSMVIVHKTICEAIMNEKLAGIKLFPVNEWNEDILFK